MGSTHVVLAKVSEDVLEGAIRTAYQLRIAANAKAGRKSSAAKPKERAPEKTPGRRSKRKGKS